MSKATELLGELNDIENQLYTVSERVDRIMDELRTESKIDFDWIIENGFLPGQKFNLGTSKQNIITVKSYAWDYQKGPVVVFAVGNKEEARDVFQPAIDIKKRIELFEKVDGE